jgi:hypothetical protein
VAGRLNAGECLRWCDGWRGEGTMVRDALMVWDWLASSSRCAGRQWQRWLGIAPGHWATGHLGTVPKKSRLASATGNLAVAQHHSGWVESGCAAVASAADRTGRAPGVQPRSLTIESFWSVVVIVITGTRPRCRVLTPAR